MGKMKTIYNLQVSTLVPLVNKKWLFVGLWKLKERAEDGEEILERLLVEIPDYSLEPKAIYNIYSSQYDGKILKLYPEGKKAEGIDLASFGLKEDLLKKMGRTEVVSERIALVAVTVGDRVKAAAEGLRSKGNYADYFYLNGLAAALTEALAEFTHRKICKELGTGHGPSTLLRAGKSLRISPGYPVWPDLGDQRIIASLLPIEQIGISISETNQLVPEFSATAMIFT